MKHLRFIVVVNAVGSKTSGTRIWFGEQKIDCARVSDCKTRPKQLAVTNSI